MNGNRNNGESLITDRGFSEVGFREYAQVLLRGKWAILGVFLSTLIIVAIVTLTTEKVYESTVSLLVDTKGQQSGLPMLDVTGIRETKNIKNELEILKSRSLVEDVARRLMQIAYVDQKNGEKISIVQRVAGQEEMDSSYFGAIVVRRLTGTVSFDPVRDSDVIKITAKSTNPHEATLIANTYANAYYDRNLLSSRARSKAVREFLQDQVKAKKLSLGESESKLQAYMEQKGIVSLDDEAKKVIDQLSQLEAERDATNIGIQSLTKTLESYREELAKQEPNVARAMGEANDPYIRLLQEQIAKLEVQRDVTVAQNPTIVGQDIYNQRLKEIDEQINSLRRKLKNRTDEYLASVLPGQRVSGQANDPASFLSEAKQKIIELQIEIQQAESKKKALADVLADYERQFESIPRKSIEYARLQRARLSDEKIYLLVDEKFSEATIKEKSEFGYIDIIDPANVPITPVSPNATLNLILGAVFGIVLGIGFVFLKEHADVRVRTPEDLKKRGLAMLTAVALMDEEIRRTGGKTTIERGGKSLDAHLLSWINPLSSISESYRRLRTSIQYAELDEPVGSILITSPNPSEGKSTTVSNLAITFAQTGKKVLLIDTDLRKPSLHSEFGVEKVPGLTDYLYENIPMKSIVRKTPVDNLGLICCGTIPPNPSEVLGSQKMKDTLRDLRNQYDVVLFDTPPVLAVTDPSVLATLVDAVVIVVSSGHTRMESLERALELMHNVHARTIGFVLNNFDPDIAYGGYYRYYQYKYYDYGYGYGSGYGQGKESKAVGRKT
jgi:tyrosine-protein kinase Etk/Wzc